MAKKKLQSISAVGCLDVRFRPTWTEAGCPLLCGKEEDGQDWEGLEKARQWDRAAQEQGVTPAIRFKCLGKKGIFHLI